MILYLDTSSLVKLYVPEMESAAVKIGHWGRDWGLIIAFLNGGEKFSNDFLQPFITYVTDKSQISGLTPRHLTLWGIKRYTLGGHRERNR